MMPFTWETTQDQHVWVKFHHDLHEDRLVVIDLMAIEGITEDPDSTLIYTANRYYRVGESVDEVLAVMAKHIKGSRELRNDG